MMNTVIIVLLLLVDLEELVLLLFQEVLMQGLVSISGGSTDFSNGSLNQLPFILFYHYYLDSCSNSRAITCEKSQLLKGMYLLD